jgi:CDP-diacylglycerol--glycerol-3-phosphate 3-phosphatidyltransferase
MGDGSFVSLETRDRLRGGATPFARAFGRIGLTPNALTVIGFLISGIAAIVAGYQLWFAAGVISVAGALFDMLDGALARATGTTSKFGAFLDSTLDRWGEGVVYVGIAAGAVLALEPVTAILAGAAMSSAFMVSYTRAKAESLGFRGEVGIAPRPERIAILAAGLIGAGVTGGPGGGPWLQLALVVIFGLSTITTIQRILYVRHQARSQAPEVPDHGQVD